MVITCKLQMQDWTGRQIRIDKRGAMPANLEPLFEWLGISTEMWVDCYVSKMIRRSASSSLHIDVFLVFL